LSKRHYVQTYLERDVRSLRQVGDLTSFQSFLQALAARNGQLLSLADLSRDLGVAVNAAKAWLSILEATFQVIVLRPNHANIGKRLVKTPKVYFTDTGMLCCLAGLKDADHAAASPLGGPIFETAVSARNREGFLQPRRRAADLLLAHCRGRRSGSGCRGRRQIDSD
jgi:predicted AAA+ superfamily ATPase